MPLKGSAVDLDAVVFDARDLVVFCRTAVFSDLLEDFGPRLRDELSRMPRGAIFFL